MPDRLTCHPLAALWAPEAEPGHCGPSGMMGRQRQARPHARERERTKRGEPVTEHLRAVREGVSALQEWR